MYSPNKTYWLRAIIRYVLAAAMLAYGIVLLIPIQIPAPSLSDLHTAYGDFLPWKVYFHSTAIASAGYRQTIGALEIVGALLLLDRRTVVFGAIIISFVLTNVVLANFAYDIGDHWPALFCLALSILLIAYDFPRLYALLVLRRKSEPDTFHPDVPARFKFFKKVARGAFALSALGYFVFVLHTYQTSNWPYPDRPGIAGTHGYYNVSSFRINDTIIPYSQADTTRWTDVVFEKWNTVSIRGNRLAELNFAEPVAFKTNEAFRNYEYIGNGGRRFYRYQYHGDTIELTNANNESDKLRLRLSRPDSSTIYLVGTNSRGDSLWVTLDRVDKEYLLHKGRRKPIAIH
jgi:hypothetical protein